MDLDQRYYFVGVQFDGCDVIYSYVCDDLSVRIGDKVLVPVAGEREIVGTVGTASFRTAEDAPYPFDRTKKVIRKLSADDHVAIGSTADASKEPKLMDIVRGTAPAPDKKEAAPKSDETGKSKVEKTVEKIIKVPVFTILFALLIAVLLASAGCDIDDEDYYLFFIAIPLGIIFAFKDDDASPSSKTSSTTKHYGGGAGVMGSGRSGSDCFGGWVPGSPENEMFSYMDDCFDFDGDGKLDTVESMVKYDTLFGDDDYGDDFGDDFGGDW